MRQLSAGMMKGLSSVKSQIPEPGTKVRFVYDYLYENRGRIVSGADIGALADLVRSSTNNDLLHSIVYNLRDYWGCDIRCTGRTRDRNYIFLGEWCGKIYIDYTRPATEQADLPTHLLDRVPKLSGAAGSRDGGRPSRYAETPASPV